MQPLCRPRRGGSLLLAAFLALCYCSHQGRTSQDKEMLLSRYPDSDIVYPVQTDEQGVFLSYDLSQRTVRKRDLSPLAQLPVYYQLHYKGLQLTFNVTVNQKLLAPGFLRERRSGGVASAEIQPSMHTSCHLIGEVQSGRLRAGLAALSSCSGLMGLFQLSKEDYFIEPMGVLQPGADSAQPHRIYRRHNHGTRTETSSRDTNQLPAMGTCGVKDPAWMLKRTERWRERWEQKQHRRRRIVQRSVSQEKWVETLVVADAKMVEFHGSAHVDSYVLTVMNMVAGLFHDASIGNPINIVVVRLILLDREEEDLKISHHADNTLKSFCKWQKSINPKGDSHPTHHDVAILITRKDICAAMNRPCETLGLSHVSGMCQPHRSCNINEDTGLPLAFTVAHELGHSFGIQHDGSGNDCKPVGKKPYIMSPQLLYDTSPLTWSRCSRDYITRFLHRGWGLCLDDPPAKAWVNFPLLPPGVLYDVGHQCRLQYGAYSTFCQDIDNVCNTLWCSVGTTCHSKLDAAVDGTKCGESKWCFNGDCVPVSFRPGPVHGGWSAWSSWHKCSRTCGAGVQNAERLCTNPTPEYGGKYCLGERQRYRLCNTQPCASEQPSFRQLQCSRFDALPYKGKVLVWIPVPNAINPCELHCRPEEDYFAEKMLDAVLDGTPCYEGSASRDVCINGICKKVGCDYEIDSSAVEDGCGVCHGDGSTCQTVKKTFEESNGLGYVDIGLIPAGAREIRIEEMAEAGNFLALRSEDPDIYFLNGGWTIQWNGDYRVAGTTFTYKRTGNWENLTAPGPTQEPVWIQLLFQETNPGVQYQYIIQREMYHENELHPSEFSWRFGSWTMCTVTCGRGVQRQIVFCVEKIAGLVEERHCDFLIRPDDIQRPCNEEPCPARWWVGEWQTCSSSCGDTGLMKRTVLCIQSVGLDEQQALQSADCQHLPQPNTSMPCNHQHPCPVEWATGIWSECSVTCGTGIQRRLVYCSNDTSLACNATQRPRSEMPCSLQNCPRTSETPSWSGSGSSSRELYNEIFHVPRKQPVIPHVGTAEEENLITSEDFTGSKKGSGTNIFVDDFYYDYNFINFHEDLFYDPLSEKDAADSQGTPRQAMVTNDNSHSPNISTAGESGGWDATADETDLAGSARKNHSRPHSQGDKTGQASETVKTTQSAPVECHSRDTKQQAGGHYAGDSLTPSTVSRPNPASSPGGPSVGMSQEDQKRTAVPTDNAPITAPSAALHTISIPAALQPMGEGKEVNTGKVSVMGSAAVSASAEEAADSDTTHTSSAGDKPLHTAQDRKAEEGSDISEGMPSFNLFQPQDTGWSSSPPLSPPTQVTTDSHSSTQMEKNKKSHEMRPPDHYSQSTATSVLTTHFPLVTSLTTASHVSLDPTQRGSHMPVSQSSWDWNRVLSTTSLQSPAASSSPALTLWPKTDSSNPGILSHTEQVPSIHPPVWDAHGTSGDKYVLPRASSSENFPSAGGPEVTVPSYSALKEQEDPHLVPVVTSVPSNSAVTEQEDPHLAPVETAVPSNSAVTEQEDPHLAPVETSVPSNRAVTEQEDPYLAPVETAVPSNRAVTEQEDPHLAPVETSVPSNRAVTEQEDPHLALVETAVPSNRAVTEQEDPHLALVETAVPSNRAVTEQEDPHLAPVVTSVPSNRAVTEQEDPHLAPVETAVPSNSAVTEQEDPHLVLAAEKPQWKAGNWSECSTTCGLGALWRAVQCSTGKDRECDKTKKPIPARRCYLRPCALWHVGNWSKCSKNCGGGLKFRDVQCIDTREQRLLRPFHCQAMLFKPSVQTSCHPEPCMEWYTSSWRECSEACGGGEQERLVTCPELGRCDDILKPSTLRSCNLHPCTTWVVGSWGECTASCGGGVQRRLVKCVNTQTGDTEEDPSKCDHEVWPENTQKCNPQDCNNTDSSFSCDRDRLTFSFCQMLRLLGRCLLPTVKVQCCRTCRVYSHSSQERGNERASRR
ncbi:LOW QUALITY PROTEIN: A disintegrin and metalloproteinase with thrombospondin motifs 7 [Rhinatrema bivittatum]|uniref:LOW QUALITY PROTEIN: A disintegrin and metalloproteinase with thrombospondin motifs 7 n=1 Tax=Rhinatrema bivittatum TaxID=194408 RepID=UPI0011284227|nr:LOW QUALITY PROTEIN: A disintegrin and metalloproteinase with thrombospondin motifs 7 [Rhinatrema bivittatum]